MVFIDKKIKEGLEKEQGENNASKKALALSVF